MNYSNQSLERLAATSKVPHAISEVREAYARSGIIDAQQVFTIIGDVHKAVTMEKSDVISKLFGV